MLVVYAQLAPIVTMKEHQCLLHVRKATSVLKDLPSLCPVLAVLTMALLACMTHEDARLATPATTAPSSARPQLIPFYISVTQVTTVSQVQADLSRQT